MYAVLYNLAMAPMGKPQIQRRCSSGYGKPASLKSVEPRRLPKPRFSKAPAARIVEEDASFDRGPDRVRAQFPRPDEPEEQTRRLVTSADHGLLQGGLRNAEAVAVAELLVDVASKRVERWQ